MKKRLFLTLVVLMGLTSAMATDEIICSDFSISRGETKTFSIQLSNEVTNYVGFQMDLTLPEGLTINKAGCSLSDRIKDEDQELTIGKQSENTYRLTSTSFSLTPISGTSGDLITVSVTASDTYQSGNATISNILFATSNSERITMNDVTFAANYGIITFADEQVKALCVANWDTNGDGELDMDEAAAVTDLGRVFHFNRDITSFDELQHFTGLASIGNYAFYSCSSLTSIIIPKSVKSMGDYAFACCTGLTSIIVDSENTVYDSRDNCNAIIEKATNTLIAGFQSTVIPNSVVSIDRNAFTGCSSLTAIVIPNSVTSIGECAFENCSALTSITIGNSVTSIGGNAFYGCSGLTSIDIPNSVKSIAQSAFISCSGLNSITVESGNTIYDSRDRCNALIETESNTLIKGCQNTIIPNSVTRIGSNAFINCSGLTSITIPNSVTSIGTSAFYGCSGLTSITIPNSVETIGAWAFAYCSGLTSITIPNSVTGIDKCTFARCSALTSITIPNSVTDIGQSAFWDCSALTSINIPNSVTSIGEWAFSNCTSLTSVVTNISSPLTINTGTFEGCENATLYVPKDCKSVYAAADVWKSFNIIKEFPDPDVNQDGSVDVVDVVDVARFVVGTPSESFDKFLADLNGSGEVNVADAVALVNEIAGDANWARTLHAPAVSDGILTLTRNADQSLSFSLKDNSAYTAFQFDLIMPEEMDVMQMTLNSVRKQNHQVLFNKIGEGHYRVVVLSTSNESFKGKTGELLNITIDGVNTNEISVHDIHFVTRNGTEIIFDALSLSGTVTNIANVRTNEGNDIIFDLQGRRLSKTQRGVNIVDGKKVIVK